MYTPPIQTNRLKENPNYAWNSKIKDPFNGFFDENPNWAPSPESLLDIPSAHVWFKALAWGSSQDLYTYQRTLEGPSQSSVVHDGRIFRMLSSYDYLGFIGNKTIESSAAEALHNYGTGTGGVRLLTGTNDLHKQLEQTLATFKQTQSALTFSSGYLANIAVVSSLMGPRDQVLIDQHAHRSLQDAVQLSRANCSRFPHNDMRALESFLQKKNQKQRVLVIADGVYSMDGDICPLDELVALKKRYGFFLMIDEAHSLGVLGNEGRGTHQHFQLSADQVDIWTGSLSKAIPSIGGFVAGSRELILYLQHVGAPFIFSAAASPSSTAAANTALNLLLREPWRIKIQRCNAVNLRNGLQKLGLSTGASSTSIVPVIIGEEEATYLLARSLHDLGYIATAVVHPAVQRGKARLRLCATASQTESDIDDALGAFSKALKTAPHRYGVLA